MGIRKEVVEGIEKDPQTSSIVATCSGNSMRGYAVTGIDMTSSGAVDKHSHRMGAYYGGKTIKAEVARCLHGH